MVLLAVVALIVVVIIAAGIDAAIYAGKVHAGVSVSGVSLGGLTEDEATATLTRHISEGTEDRGADHERRPLLGHHSRGRGRRPSTRPRR